MTLAVKVAGGTDAGRKRPPHEPRQEWECDRGHVNKGCWTRCFTLGCNQPRPKENP